MGKAIAESGVPRKNLFITTKLWTQDQGYENAEKAFQTSLDRLGLDYLELGRSGIIDHGSAETAKFLNGWKIHE